MREIVKRGDPRYQVRYQRPGKEDETWAEYLTEEEAENGLKRCRQEWGSGTIREIFLSLTFREKESR